MLIDPSNTLVTVTLEGLFVVCKNDRLNRWEIGVPELGTADEHVLTIEYFTITGAGTGEIKRYHLPREGNIEIINDAAEPLPVQYFPPPPPPPLPSFDGPRDVGDIHDYRWIIDLEDRRFHHGGVEARPDVGRHYKRKIFVDGGQLFTIRKSYEQYRRFRASNPQGTVRSLGKLAVAVGIDLPRDQSDGGDRTVTIKYEEGSPHEVPLEQHLGIGYGIRLKNLCPIDPDNRRPSTDFDQYYNILRAKDDTKVSIQSERTELPPPRDESDPTGPPRGGEEPQVCNVILLGQTGLLPGV